MSKVSKKIVVENSEVEPVVAKPKAKAKAPKVEKVAVVEKAEVADDVADDAEEVKAVEVKSKPSTAAKTKASKPAAAAAAVSFDAFESAPTFIRHETIGNHNLTFHHYHKVNPEDGTDLESSGSILIFGDTKPFSNRLKAAGAKYNSAMNHPVRNSEGVREKIAGWWVGKSKAKTPATLAKCVDDLMAIVRMDDAAFTAAYPDANESASSQKGKNAAVAPVVPVKGAHFIIYTVFEIQGDKMSALKPCANRKTAEDYLATLKPKDGSVFVVRDVKCFEPLEI